MERESSGTEYIMLVINRRLKKAGVSKRQLTYGICESGLINQLVNGSGRKLDKTTIDALLQRLGMRSRTFEAFVDMEEYELLKKRERIRKLIDEKKAEKAESEINEYLEMNLGNIDRQFGLFFLTHVMAIKEADYDEQIKTATEALQITIPGFSFDDAEKYLYSEVEMQLACRIAFLHMKSGKEKEAVYMMKKLYELEETGVYCEYSMNRFAQLTYELAKYGNRTGGYQYVIDICTKAIAKMPRANSFRFLPQIYNEKAKADILFIYSHKPGYGEVYDKIYKNSLEYRYYKMLNSIYEMFEYEFNPDEHYVMVREYNAVPLGKIIKQRRMLRNMKQSELIISDNETINEEGLICSEDTISRLENGKVSVSWKVAARLLEKLNLPPARYFDYYISSDENVVNDISEITGCLTTGQYVEAYKRLINLENKNEYSEYAYNKIHIARTMSSIGRGLNNFSEEEILKMHVETFNRCVPGYLEKQEEVFLLLEEEGLFSLIICRMMNLGNIDLKNKIKAYEKVIKGYVSTECDMDICIRHLLKIKRIHESSIANLGEIKKANTEAIECIKMALKHDLFGCLGGFIYDYAWNQIQQGCRDDVYGSMINCAYVIEKLMHNLSLCRLCKELYFKEFDNDKWDEFYIYMSDSSSSSEISS